jgi:hypothetical protein
VYNDTLDGELGEHKIDMIFLLNTTNHIIFASNKQKVCVHACVGVCP